MTNTVYVAEPFPQLARLAWEQALNLCNPAHGCVDYHRCWSLVRWLQQDGALPSSSEFYVREIRKLAEQGRNRVLISGAADTGTMTIVLNAFAESGQHPRLVLADHCQTPLMQCRYFAEQLELEAEYVNGDIRELAVEPVDMVVAHSFLHFFPEPARSQVVQMWARILKPGGYLLLTNSCCDSEEEGPPPKSPAEIRPRIPLLIDRAETAGFTPEELVELAGSAMRFWQTNWWQQPYITPANLRNSLLAAGFKIEAMHLASNSSIAPSRSFSQPAKRVAAEILAIKPVDWQ